VDKLDEKTDYSECTWAGAEAAQLRKWRGLTLQEKLKANEEMGKTADYMIQQRSEQGLPYIDPDTGECVR
tara:strand:- start:422 stop:631 length:210 start_codon:yes stop_codon:yes gene_type:complete